MTYIAKALNVNILMKAIIINFISCFTFSIHAIAHETGHPSVEVAYVTVAQARTLRANDPAVIVLDVRTKGEYKRGHIEGAVRNNYFSFKYRKRLRALDRNAHYIVHCKSGHRSERVVKHMIKDGFTRITHMDGGFDAWKKLPASPLHSKTD